MLLAGFSALAPESKSAAKIMVVTQTRMDKLKLKDLYNNSCEVQASSPASIEKGVFTIIAPFD